MKEYEAKIKERLEPFTDVPIIFTSALTKQRVHKAVETAVQVYENLSTRIPTSELNEVMLPIIERNPPPATKGKFVRIKYCMQLPTRKTAFAFYCNLPQYVKDPYKRYIENRLREQFDLSGIPILLFFRKK